VLPPGPESPYVVSKCLEHLTPKKCLEHL